MAEVDGIKPNEVGVQFPRLASLLRYWRSKCAGRPMPARSDVDPIEIPSLLPIVILAEVAGGEVRMRLMGEEALAGYVCDVRGRSVREIPLGGFSPSWNAAFDLVLASSAPAIAAGLFGEGAHLSRAEALLVPLADGLGAISHIFGGLVVKPVPRDQAVPQPDMSSYVQALPGHRVDGAEDLRTRAFPARRHGRVG